MDIFAMEPMLPEQLRRAARGRRQWRGRKIKIPSLVGLEERGARNVTAALVSRGMLTATSHRSPLRLAFPADVAERWFPNLYPANAGARS